MTRKSRALIFFYQQLSSFFWTVLFQLSSGEIISVVSLLSPAPLQFAKL